MLVADDDPEFLREQKDRHQGIFRAPGDRPKQPGTRDWKRADWCVYRGAQLLQEAKKITDAALGGTYEEKETAARKARPVRLEAVKLMAEYRMRRRAALIEGYQPRSEKARAEAAKIEAAMAPLERAQMHRRQKLWLNDYVAATEKVPKWAKSDPVTDEEQEMLTDKAIAERLRR